MNNADYRFIRFNLFPMDVLRFRRPKPFRVGGYAQTELLPPSSTVAGALLTELYYRDLIPRANSFEEFVKKLESEGVFFRGPFYGQKGGLLFPSPCDIRKCKYCKKLFLVPWKEDQYVKGIGYPLSVPWPPCPSCGRASSLVTDSLISSITLKLRSERQITELKSVHVAEIKDDARGIVRTQVRPGITLKDEYKVVKPGYFYSAEWLELVGVHIVEYASLPQRYLDALKYLPLLWVGGNRRPVIVSSKELELNEVCKELSGGYSIEELSEEIARSGRFDLLILTPAIFIRREELRSKGRRTSWLPDWLINGKGELEGLKMKLIGVGLHKPLLVSGWDLRLNAPKNMYAAVSPGSMFRFEILGDVSPQQVGRFLREVLVKGVGRWRAVGYGTAVAFPAN